LNSLVKYLFRILTGALELTEVHFQFAIYWSEKAIGNEDAELPNAGDSGKGIVQRYQAVLGSEWKT